MGKLTTIVSGKPATKPGSVSVQVHLTQWSSACLFSYTQDFEATSWKSMVTFSKREDYVDNGPEQKHLAIKLDYG